MNPCVRRCENERRSLAEDLKTVERRTKWVEAVRDCNGALCKVHAERVAMASMLYHS